MDEPITPSPPPPATASATRNGPFRRSWSSPTLSKRSNRSQSLNDQLLEFADKFVDTIDDNNDEIAIARSPTTSTISTTYWESEYNANSSWITSKIGYNTPYCKHRHSCFQFCSFVVYIYIVIQICNH